MAEMPEMTEEERKALWKQFAQVHAAAQETSDASVRTLVAAGIVASVPEPELQSQEA